MPPSSISVLKSRSKRALKIVYLPISKLKPNPNNPRLHSPKQVKQIAASIREFGWTVPILKDGDHCVIAGHGRLQAAEMLGLTEVPTIELRHLSAAQQRALIIADNRLTEIAAWDDNLLANELLELSKLELSFDLEITGFETPEIDLRIQGLNQLRTSEPDESDKELPPLPSNPVTRRGDIWILGAHRVMCGNALDHSDYQRLFVSEQAAATITDPPYNVRIAGNVSGKGKNQHREFAMASGEMSSAEFLDFLQKTFEKHKGISKKGALYYYFIDWRHLIEMLLAGRSAFSQLINVCVWAKTNGGMGSLYRSQHEHVLVFKNGDAPHKNNVELGKHGRNRTNVWNYEGMNSFGRNGEEGNLLSLHPTVKPVRMIADAILDCTKRKEIVLDSFLGSGTTVIAAEKTGRRCFGLELDNAYVDVSIRRWQALTGEKAVHETTSMSFSEVEANRRSGHE